MAPGLGLAIVTCLMIARCRLTTSLALEQQKEVFNNHPHDGQTLTPRWLEITDETPRVYFDTIKSYLTRIIKYYRIMKPEIKVAMCFSRYVGISASAMRNGRSSNCGQRRCASRAMMKPVKSKHSEKETEVTLKGLLQDIVHVVMLLLSDFTPQPMTNVMRMASNIVNMTRIMYNSLRQDEMGTCVIDYTSNRFWWWLGI